MAWVLFPLLEGWQFLSRATKHHDAASWNVIKMQVQLLTKVETHSLLQRVLQALQATEMAHAVTVRIRLAALGVLCMITDTAKV